MNGTLNYALDIAPTNYDFSTHYVAGNQAMDFRAD